MLPEAVRRLGVLSARQRRQLEGVGASRQALRRAGFAYHPGRRVWCQGSMPRLLAHQLAVAELLVAAVALGQDPTALTISPLLPYRSPAGGKRSLDPDALLRLGGLPVAIEVDMGTESARVLRHKWYRYREYRQEVVALPLLVVAPPGRHRLVRATLVASGLDRVGVGHDLVTALDALRAEPA